MLTKRDYTKLADVLDRGFASIKYAETDQKKYYEESKIVVFKLCIRLKKDNEKFNTDKFLGACGLN